MIDATVGRLFPAGDAQALADQLRSLHLDPSGLAQMQARARDHVQQHFSWEAATQKYCALYDSLAD